jgi:DNA polymerase sigma
MPFGFSSVKFRDPATGLDCDLNTNDQLGLWNTQLISRYCDLAPDLVRPMIMAIKRWAKSHGMNDPSGQYGPVTFSSYALVLMVIGFLQASASLGGRHVTLNKWFLGERRASELASWAGVPAHGGQARRVLDANQERRQSAM